MLCVSAAALARVHSCFNLNDFGIVIPVLNFTCFVSESSAAMKSAACLSNMKPCTTGQPDANGIDAAKEISQPLCTFYNLLCSSPINSRIDFPIKHKLHSYCSPRKKPIDYIGTRYLVKTKCLKHLNVVSSVKVHKSRCLML